MVIPGDRVPLANCPQYSPAEYRLEMCQSGVSNLEIRGRILKRKGRVVLQWGSSAAKLTTPTALRFWRCGLHVRFVIRPPGFGTGSNPGSRDVVLLGPLVLSLGSLHFIYLLFIDIFRRLDGRYMQRLSGEQNITWYDKVS